jgi:hypothetical protein
MSIGAIELTQLELFTLQWLSRGHAIGCGAVMGVDGGGGENMKSRVMCGVILTTVFISFNLDFHIFSLSEFFSF